MTQLENSFRFTHGSGNSDCVTQPDPTRILFAQKYLSTTLTLWIPEPEDFDFPGEIAASRSADGFVRFERVSLDFQLGPSRIDIAGHCGNAILLVQILTPMRVEPSFNSLMEGKFPCLLIDIVELPVILTRLAVLERSRAKRWLRAADE